MSIERSEMRASFLRRLDDRALPVLVGAIKRVTRHKVELGWVAAAAGVAVLAGAVLAGGRFSDDPPPVTPSVAKVGPAAGTLIAGYVAGAQRELATLAGAGSGPVYALVSLAGYGTPAQAAGLSGGYAVSKAYFRVPLVGVQTEIRSVDVADVRGDLEGHMRSAAARAERDAKEADVQAAKLTGSSARESQLRAFYVESARLLRVQAREYRSLCACVYSFVVKATPQDLAMLARRPGVRVVDPAPEVSRLDRTVFLPLLPEQRITVAPPPDTLPGSLPAPGPS